LKRERIQCVWDELADFGADRSAVHLMSFLCQQGGAWNATWAGVTRLGGEGDDDPLQGWNAGALMGRWLASPLDLSKIAR